MHEEFSVSEVPTVVVTAPLDDGDFELFRFTINEDGNVVIPGEEFEPKFLPMFIAGLERMVELLGCDEYDPNTDIDLDDIIDGLNDGEMPSAATIRKLVRVAKGRFE